MSILSLQQVCGKRLRGSIGGVIWGEHSGGGNQEESLLGIIYRGVIQGTHSKGIGYWKSSLRLSHLKRVNRKSFRRGLLEGPLSDGFIQRGHSQVQFIGTRKGALLDGVIQEWLLFGRGDWRVSLGGHASFVVVMKCLSVSLQNRCNPKLSYKYS